PGRRARQRRGRRGDHVRRPARRAAAACAGPRHRGGARGAARRACAPAAVVPSRSARAVRKAAHPGAGTRMTEALYISGALAFSAALVLALGTALELEGRLRPLMV